MRAHISLILVTLGGFTSCITPSMAQVVTVVNDGFADGNRTNGADANDISWYSTHSSSSAVGNTVVTDANFTSGKALRFTSSSGNDYVAGNFSAVTLGQVGDYIEFSMTMRFTTALGTDAARGPMIGLFDSKGTYQTADGFGAGTYSNLLDDVGYKSIKVVPSSSSDVRIISQNPVTSSFSSSAGATLTTGSSGGALALNTLYTMVFRVELINATDVTITSTFNGVLTSITGTALTTTFDEALFSASGGASAAGTADFGNLLITTNVGAVPEPSAYALLAGVFVLSVVAFARYRRRGQS